MKRVVISVTLDIIDHTIDRATRNMARVAKALDDMGPGTMDIG